MNRVTAFAAVAGLACIASADSVLLDATFQGIGLGGGVSGTFDQNDNGIIEALENRGTFAGQLNYDFTVNSVTTRFVTYCTELEQRPGRIGQSFQYCQEPVANAPDPFGPMGAVKAAAVDTLFRTSFSAANTNLLASAFQVVLWEIVYDYDGTAASINFNTGRLQFFTDFSSQATAWTAAFNAFATAAATNPLDLGFSIALTSDTLQDQITVGRVVPLPTAVWAAIPAIAAVAGFRALRRR